MKQNKIKQQKNKKNLHGVSGVLGASTFLSFAPPSIAANNKERPPTGGPRGEDSEEGGGGGPGGGGGGAPKPKSTLIQMNNYSKNHIEWLMKERKEKLINKYLHLEVEEEVVDHPFHKVQLLKFY